MIPYLVNDIYQYPVTKADASKAASDTMVHIRQASGFSHANHYSIMVCIEYKDIWSLHCD